VQEVEPVAASHCNDFFHEQPFTPDSLVEHINSISFIAALPDSERVTVLDAVRELAASHSDNFTLPLVTHVYATQNHAD
jgi:hypothetical protein